MSGEKPRQIAFSILKRHAEGTHYVEDVLERVLADANPSATDRGLAQELTFGVVRWQATLDWLIAQKTEERSQRRDLQILLRLGLYQIFWLDRIPDHAAVHETVALAKDLGFGPQAGFINAILRGYLRERDATRKQLDEIKSSRPSLGYSHPQWLCDRWESRWGREPLQALLRWNNTPPATYARLNKLRTDAATLTAAWEQENVRFKPREWNWTGPDLVYELESHSSLAALPSFQQGFFYVQDPSTLLAVSELELQPGQSVLDFCAAPGGKTTFIAQLMNNQGYVMAQDLDLRRRQLIRQNCDRLGVNCVQISRATTAVNLQLSEPFDRVLVDVPCSNTGVMRRRVDLRWRIRHESLERLQAAQLELLRRASDQVRVAGALVYSTCSLEPEENNDVIRAFLDARPQFKLDRERMLLPFSDGVDGAYVARLVRAAD